MRAKLRINAISTTKSPLLESGYSEELFTPWEIMKTIQDKTSVKPAKLQRAAGTIVTGNAIFEATTATEMTAKAIVSGKGMNLRLVLVTILETVVVVLGSVMQNLREASSIKGGGHVVAQY